MEKNKLEQYYNKLLKYDVDYHEIFHEATSTTRYYYINQRIDDITSKYINGIGFTLSKGDKKFYASTSNLEESNNIIEKLGSNFPTRKYKDITLTENSYVTNKNYNNYDKDFRKNLFEKINSFCRSFDKRITQVEITLLEKIQNVTIINDESIKKEDRLHTRIAVSLIAKEKDKTASNAYSPGFAADYSFLNDINLEEKLKETCEILLEKLNTVSFEGGKMPVIIGPGFGAVIFHEACGHAMESYSIINKTSVLTNKLNKKVANEKVTIIDDGTYENLYGTTTIDDQGEETRKNILIKDGILVNYLTDKIDAKLLNSKSTGSGRRENYTYSSISRMNNTYLVPGNDKIEDMIKSISYGLYATKMGGGSVSPNTGEFNFTVSFGYIIKDGKITKPIQNVALIGNTLEILNNVEMISEDLDFGPGVCGSYSGNLYNTCGQPTIKVSSILVGGNKDE